jgi:RNA polymerase sigma-70 factor (ECF subfamily)
MLKQTRRRQVSTGHFDEAKAAQTHSAASEEDVVRTELIRIAVSALPDLQRQVVVLRHLEGHSTREVSRILRCSEGTVKTHLFRGLKKLRVKLEFLREEMVDATP